MDAFTLLPIVMAIAVAVLVGAFWMILSTQCKSVARLLALPTFDEYRDRHPERVTDGKVLCSKCVSNRVFVHLGHWAPRPPVPRLRDAPLPLGDVSAAGAIRYERDESSVPAHAHGIAAALHLSPSAAALHRAPLVLAT